jgi:hypothetical protein
MSKTQPYGADRCPNCNRYGTHFVPPSCGDEGFFICEIYEDEETDNESTELNGQPTV